MVAINCILRILFFVILFKGHVADVLVKNMNNYGPYDIEFTRCEACAGSKSKNLTHYTLEMNKIGEDYFTSMNLTFLAPSRFDEVKVTLFVLKENQKTLLFNYKSNDPCQHYAFAVLIEKFLNANKCVIQKGNYALNINFSEVTRKFYGTSFFYGDFLMKANVVSRKGNILCLLVNARFNKK